MNWELLLLFIISVFFLTISAMYLSAVNSCKSKDTKQIVFNPNSYKFGVILLIISIFCVVGPIAYLIFNLTPAGKAFSKVSSLSKTISTASFGKWR